MSARTIRRGFGCIGIGVAVLVALAGLGVTAINATGERTAAAWVDAPCAHAAGGCPLSDWGHLEYKPENECMANVVHTASIGVAATAVMATTVWARSSPAWLGSLPASQRIDAMTRALALALVLAVTHPVPLPDAMDAEPGYSMRRVRSEPVPVSSLSCFEGGASARNVGIAEQPCLDATDI